MASFLCACLFLIFASADGHFVCDVSNLNMDKLTIPMLKSELQRRELPTRGAKMVLTDRLRQALENEGKDPGSYSSEILTSGSYHRGRLAIDGRREEPARSKGRNAGMSPLPSAHAISDETHGATEDIQQRQEDGPGSSVGRALDSV